MSKMDPAGLLPGPEIDSRTVTFYASYAEDIRKTCVCYWEGWVWGAGGGSSLLAFL